MSWRNALPVSAAILLLIAGVGVSTFHAHEAEESSSEFTCSACVLAHCPTIAPHAVNPVDPSTVSERLAIADDLPVVVASSHGPAPTRGPPVS